MKVFERLQDALEQRVEAVSHDETVLQQSQVWVRAVLWGLMGTTAFAIGWLALAQTEEIVVAPGKLEPIGAVKEVQMPIGGIAEQIEDGVSGFLVPVDDTVALADKLAQLKQDPALRARFGRAARARFEALFTTSKMIAEYVKILEISA